MKLLKKSQPQPEAAPAVSLADQLTAACDAAEAYIATIAQREKDASPLQPLGWHQMQIYLRYGRCACKCALALLEKEKHDGR
jgi:hypothetical protein